MTGDPVRTVFLGSGSFAVPILHVLVTHPAVALVGVVTAPPRPAGRRGLPTATPVADAAGGLMGVPILVPGRLRDPAAAAAVLDLDPALVVLADYGQIVPPALLGSAHGALNLHPSLLPRHRGATPVPAAILAGDAETGVTLMRMDAGLDTGPIIAQTRVTLTGEETAPALEATLAILAADLLARDLEPWIRGVIVASPQPDEGATLTRPLRREDGRLDVTLPADALARRIRAYQPWPGSFVETDAGRLVIWSASPAAAAPGSTPGTFDTAGLVVGDGERLVLHEVQPSGGTRMAWDAFVRGRPAIVGSRVRNPAAG